MEFSYDILDYLKDKGLDKKFSRRMSRDFNMKCDEYKCENPTEFEVRNLVDSLYEIVENDSKFNEYFGLKKNFDSSQPSLSYYLKKRGDGTIYVLFDCNSENIMFLNIDHITIHEHIVLLTKLFTKVNLTEVDEVKEEFKNTLDKIVSTMESFENKLKTFKPF